MDKQIILMAAMLLLLCFMLMPQQSYGHQGYLRANFVHRLGNRKVLVVNNKYHEEKHKDDAEMGRELREAPMGPDPLHHNGAPPRKPRTTP